ncbi:his Kinase A domain protein, partial [Vibrio parahaemolyticus V-223/04]
WII